MAAEHIHQVSSPAPCYYSNHYSHSSRSSSSSFDTDIEKAILEHLTTLPSYTQEGMKDGTTPPPNTPSLRNSMEEKKDGVVVDVESLEKKARLETPQRRCKRYRDGEVEDSGFTNSCTILAFIICVSLVLGPCAFALYKATGSN